LQCEREIKKGTLSPYFILMIDKNKIKDAVNQVIMSPEFLVDIAIDKQNNIQIFVDSLEDFGINSCIRISKEIENILDREIEDYQLDVSSPGLDRSFKVIQQFKKYINRQIDVKTDEDNYTNAILTDVNESQITIQYNRNKKEEKREIEFKQIIDAKPSISFK
jgi:ribosome maturation factor RimP